MLVPLSLLCLPILAHAFTHPGLLHTTADLARMASYVTKGRAGTPSRQYSTYLLLAGDPLSRVGYKPHAPVATLTSRSAFEHDAVAAYQNALMWYLTGDQTHAGAAIKIMDAWSGTLKAVDPGYRDRQLASSLGPFVMTNAAEIIRYTGAGWSDAGIRNFETMLASVFYPILNDDSGAQYQANVGTGNTKAMMAFAVFTNNLTMYEQAVNWYSNEKCSGLAQDISPTGQSSESGRDQAHTQLGLGNLAESARVALGQGTNLYTLLSDRLLLGFEYTARYGLGQDVPYDPEFQRCDAGKLGGPFRVVSEQGKGAWRPVYEIVGAYYGLKSMPFTEQVIEKVVTETGSGSSNIADNAGYGTLTYRTL